MEHNVPAFCTIFSASIVNPTVTKSPAPAPVVLAREAQVHFVAMWTCHSSRASIQLRMHAAVCGLEMSNH